MENSPNSSQKNNINPLAWFLTLAVLIAFACLSYFCTIHFETIRKRSQVAALEVSYQISGETSYANLEELNSILKPQGIAEYISSDKQNSALAPITAIAKNLNQNKFSEVDAYLIELENKVDPILQKEIDKFSEIYTSVQGLTENKASLIAEKTSKKLELEAMLDDYKLLQKEMSDFFGVSASESDEIKLYTEGVLSGLPPLKNIADNIVDLPALVDALTMQQAQIVFPENLSADEQRNYFDEKISTMKDAAFNLSLRYDGVVQRNTEIARILQETEEKLQHDLKEANVLLATLAFQYANDTLA